MSFSQIGKTSEALKKTFAVLTMATTILSLSGLAVLAPTVASAAVPSDYGLKEGNTISAAGSSDPDIYIVNAWGYKRLFLNPVIFNFYGHLGGFAAVKTVSTTARDAFPTSGLFTNCETNDGKVYGIEVNGEDTGVLHWVNVDGASAVAADPNFFKKTFCINNNEFNWYPKGANYTSASQIPNYSRGGTGATPTPTVAGNVTVSLAYDNPVSGTLVKGQASADLAHFTFTGSGLVTNIKLNRIGISADSDLANVYLYDGSKRLTDSATVSNSQITFNDPSGLFTLSGSRTISVRADLSGSTSGQTEGVQLISVNGSAVNLTGNLFTVANATLATVALSTSTTPGTNTGLDPANDVPVWQNTVTVGTRYVWLKSLQLRVIGSVLLGDVQNFRLYIDGVQAGSAVAQQDANGYILFDLNGAPVSMQTGGRVLKVLADVVNGSGRTFNLSLRQASDLTTTDSQYNQNVLATGTFTVDSGVQTISPGTLTATKRTDSPAGDVVKGASGAVLGRWDLKAAGERMKVESLRVTFTAKDSAGVDSSVLTQLRNAALFANGVQVGSTATLNEDSHTAPAYTQFSLGSALVITPGTPVVLEVRADIFDNDSGGDDTATGSTIQAVLTNDATTNVQKLTSLAYIAFPNSTTNTANTLTIRTGALTVAKYAGFANQNVTSPKANTKLGHYTIAAASSEDVNMNTIDITAVNTSGFTNGTITNAYIKVWNDAGSLIYTSPVKSSFTTTTVASNSFAVNFTLPKNKTYQVEVWGDVGSGITANTSSMNTEFDAIGVTAGSSTTANVTRVSGQTVTISAGSLTVANGSLPAAILARSGDTKNVYSFTLQPAYDDYTLDEVYVGIASTSATYLASSSGAIAQLQLKDSNGNILSTANVNSVTGSASFVGLNRSVSQSGGTQTYKVDVVLSQVGPGMTDSYGKVLLNLDGLKYHNSSGTVTTTAQANFPHGSFASNEVRTVAGYPVFTNQALSSTLLSTGAKDIFQTQISSVGTGVVIRKLVFSISKSASPVIGTVGQDNTSNSTFKLFKDGTDISSLGTFATASFDLKSTAGTAQLGFTFNNDEAISNSGAVYKLQVNVTTAGSSPQSIVTSIANTKTTSTTPEDFTTVNAALSTTSPTVIWSDSSTVAHGATTDDWFNDYLVKTLNTSQSVSL